MKFELTHVRHDPAHCLTPGLFRSLKPGERKKSKLDIIYEYGDGKRIEFSGPEPLGADDLRVLQGLIALAGPRTTGFLLSPDPKTENGQQLRQALETKWDASAQDAMVVKGSYRALAHEKIGYADIEDPRSIKECIERLWKVSIIFQYNGKRKGSRLLADYESDFGQTEGKLFVALNPMIAEAIIGRKCSYTRIEMSEVRALKSDPARLIHQRLCGWIDPGKSGRVELDTLCEYVWPDKTSTETMKKRRQKVRKVLTELIDLKWDVEEYARNKWKIERPKNIPA